MTGEDFGYLLMFLVGVTMLGIGWAKGDRLCRAGLVLVAALLLAFAVTLLLYWIADRVGNPATPAPSPTSSPAALIPEARPARPVLMRIRVRSTAYCATGSRTTSGVWPRVGHAATLESVPFGTLVNVPGRGQLTVVDRIGHGSQLDLYFGAGPSCERAADRYGVQPVIVTVARWGPS